MYETGNTIKKYTGLRVTKYVGCHDEYSGGGDTDRDMNQKLGSGISRA